MENAGFFDDSEKWFGLDRKKFISVRSQLIRSTLPIKASEATTPSSAIQKVQELAMAKNPVEVSVELKNKISHSVLFSDAVAPLGPKGELERFELNENPLIDRKVDYIVSDTGAKSFDAVKELYFSNHSVGFISRLLSAGLLGEKNLRRFVPTRWSITATDDAVSRELIENKIKGFQQINELLLFYSSYVGNSFFVLLVSHSWAFEQLEAKTAVQNSAEPEIFADFEFFGRRKNYASNVAGAYYAARLAIAEHLVKIKRQAAVVVFREISPEYKSSLGVWVIRETVRNALKQKPIVFEDISLVVRYLEEKLSVSFSLYKKKSALLEFLMHQKKLF